MIEIIDKIKSKGILYNVLSNFICGRGTKGLGCFYFPDGVGTASADFGFLGCASKEIAKYFGKYFGILLLKLNLAIYLILKLLNLNINNYGVGSLWDVW